MLEQNNILDDFSEQQVLPRSYYYKNHLALIFVLIWGIAFLHWQKIIDIMPAPEKPIAWVGISLILISTTIVQQKVVNFSWFFSVFMAIVIVVVCSVCLEIIIEVAELDARKLPLSFEIARLSIFSGGFSFISIATIEICYRITQKNKHKYEKISS